MNGGGLAAVFSGKPGILVYLLLGLLSIFQVRFGIIPAWTAVHSDFPNYYTASRLMLEGRDLSSVYDDAWFQRAITMYGMTEPGKFSPFPPATACVMLPVAWLSPIGAKRVFLGVNLVLLIAAAAMVSKITRFTSAGALAIVLLPGAALSNDLMLGQFYVILVALMLGAYVLHLRDASGSAGALWGIGAAVKYIPLIFTPVLIMQRKWRALAWLLGTYAAITAAACLIFGVEASGQFFRRVVISHVDGDLSGQSPYAVAFQSWNSFLRHVFVYDPVENPSPFLHSLAAFQLLRSVVWMVFPTAAAAVLYRVRRHREAAAYAFIAASLLVFVLSPASASYHLVLLVFPMALLLRASIHASPRYAMLFLLLYGLIGFSPVLMHRMDVQTVGLAAAYSRLWLIVLLFVSALMFIEGEGRSSGSASGHVRSTIPKGTPSIA